MVNGGTVNNWMCINFSRNVQDSLAAGFCTELAHMCKISGVVWLFNMHLYCFQIDDHKMLTSMSLQFMQAFAPIPILPPYNSRPDHVERALKTRYQDAMTILQPQGKELDLLIVILPDNNGSLYGM